MIQSDVLENHTSSLQNNVKVRKPIKAQKPLLALLLRSIMMRMTSSQKGCLGTLAMTALLSDFGFVQAAARPSPDSKLSVGEMHFTRQCQGTVPRSHASGMASMHRLHMHLG